MFNDERPRKGKRTAWEQAQEQQYNEEFRRRWDALLAKPDSELPAWAVRIKRNREQRKG